MSDAAGTGDAAVSDAAGTGDAAVGDAAGTGDAAVGDAAGTGEAAVGDPAGTGPAAALRPGRPAAHPAAGPGLLGPAVDLVTDLGYAAGWRAVRLLPGPVAREAFDAAGRLAALQGGRGVRQLRANLRVVTGGRLTGPELDALTVRAMRSYARYWREAFRLPAMDRGRVLARTEALGGEHLARHRDAGRAMVVALPHSGNWDAAGMWFVDLLGGPFMSVAERLRPESLFRRFVAYRESLGIRIVPLTGGPRPGATVLQEWLDAGGSVCLVADRDLGGGGVAVQLFGRPAALPGGPALLAARTGAALHPAVCRFTEHGWQLDIRPEVPVDGPGRLRDRVAAATQAVADAFTDGIAVRPEDWHALGRIWPDVPPDPPPGGGREVGG